MTSLSDQGREAARMALGNTLAALKEQVSDLDRVSSILQLVGYVRCTPSFADQTEVIDAASEVLLATFGAVGAHTRVAVGTNALPRGVAVELVLMASVTD